MNILRDRSNISGNSESLLYQAQKCSAIIKLLLEVDGEALHLAQAQAQAETERDTLASMDNEVIGGNYRIKQKQAATKKAKRDAARIQASKKLMDQVTDMCKSNNWDVEIPTSSEGLKELIDGCTQVLHAGLRVSSFLILWELFILNLLEN